MKARFRFMLFVLLLLSLLLLTGCSVEIDGGDSIDFGDRFVDFLIRLGDLVPAVAFGAPLFAVIIDTAKRFGLSGKWIRLASVALNFTLFAILYMVGPGGEGDVRNVVDALYALSPYIIALFTALLATPGVHNTLKPVGLAYSHAPH